MGRNDRGGGKKGKGEKKRDLGKVSGSAKDVGLS